MHAVFEIMVERLVGHMFRMQAVREEELVEVNAELRRLGLEEIVPDEVVMRVVS